MATVVERSTLRAAQEIFRALGAAFSDVRIYAAGHPRAQGGLERLARLVEEFFAENDEFGSLTFTVSPGEIEFQGVPLVQLGTGGERIRDVMRAIDHDALRIGPQITAAGLSSLLEVLDRCARGVPPPRVAKVIGEVRQAAVTSRCAGPTELDFQFIRCAEAASVSLGGEFRLAGEAAGEREGGEASIEIPELRVSQSACRSVLTTYRSLLASLEAGRSVEPSALVSAADGVVSAFARQRELAMPPSFQTYFDDFTFHHSVNVCLIATSLAAALTDDEDLLRRISLAALLHDIGKARVPAEILHKPGKLTDSEFERLRRHPVDGAEILMGIEEIDPLCVAVAFSHHIGAGDRSYPKTRKPVPSSWITELVSVVDVYEALVAVRPYKRGFSSAKAFEIMLSMPGLAGRERLIKLLYDRIGPYPTGVAVELSTGERAIVTAQNPSAPFRPRVKVLSDERRNRLSEPITLDLDGPPPAGRPAAAIRRTVLLAGRDEDPVAADALAEPEDILGVAPNDDGVLMGREG